MMVISMDFKTMLAASIAHELYPGHKLLKDGMSAKDAVSFQYPRGGRIYLPAYRHITVQLDGGAIWEIWLADIDEERIVFYKNLRQLSE